MPSSRPFAVAALALLSASPLAAQPLRNGPLPQPLPLFPPDNWWNVRITDAPVDDDSAAMIAAIGGAGNPGMHPDFGGDVDPEDPSNPEIYGFPYASVPGTQPRVPVHFVWYYDESDYGYPGHALGYPIPNEAKTQPRWIEGGNPGNVPPDGDRHMLIVDRDNRILYELYSLYWNAAQSRWEAGSGAIFPLDGNERRPSGWTSGDAAGLAIFPGLVRYDELFDCNPFGSTNCTLRTQPIRHAFRVTIDGVCGFVYPASHQADTGCPNAPPLGARLRLEAGKDISGYPAYIQKIFQAMKDYGLIVADTGSDMYVQGTYDPRWNNDELNPAFASLKASDFEVVELGWRPSAAQPSGGRDFYTLAPCRLLDTRNDFGPWGKPALAPPWTAAQRPGPPAPPTRPGHRIVRAHGQCGIPPTARALAVNVTVVGPSGQGYVTLFPGDETADDGLAGGTSTLNFSPGRTRANNAIVPLAASGSGTFGIELATSGGPTHVVVDVSGYFE